MLLALTACWSLDDVPVIEGPHCAPDVVGLVVDVLDGDTIRVVLAADPNEDGEGTAVISTGSEDSVDTADTGGGSSNASADDMIDVRMLGVDAPEIAHNASEVADCYGPEAQDFLTTALLGETVILSFDRECTDKYDRTLAYVILTHGENTWDVACGADGDCMVTYDVDLSPSADVMFNDIVIRYGYARFYYDFDNIRLADPLTQAEEAAKTANRGLWAQCE
jgi:endonuclease YncB( thermonuclease family)